MDAKKNNPVSKSNRLYLEEICTRFENEWRKDNVNQLEEFLETVEAPLKSAVAIELVAVDLELRAEIGEDPNCDEYLERLPGYSSGVRKGFELWNSERCANVYGDKNLPERIGDYRIVSKLGEGGMGVVYEAVQESLDRRVAIKSLGSHPVHAPRSARRFRREARAVAMLHHTNIINVYGSGVHDGIPYFAMQLVDGSNVREIIDQIRECRKDSNVANRGLLSCLEVARIGVQVASALEYAHQQGVLHRDIKPSNLLLDENGTAWVSDFGLAKVKNGVDATFSGDVVGTMRYVPPEATTGNWTELGDVYSLGVTLYEMLTFEPAYPETDRVELMNRITHGDYPVALRRVDPQIPRDLETIVNKAMSREQSSRYPSAAELGRELRRFVDGEPIIARPTSSTERLVKWSRRRPLTAGLSAMILVLFTFGLPFLTWLWLQTEVALNTAEAERMRAEGAKLEAEVSRKVSEIARLDSVVSEYGSTMQLAHSYLKDKNVTEARRLLQLWSGTHEANQNQPRIDPRGWEWRYLIKQIDQSLLTFPGEMEYVWHVAISPDDAMIATVQASDSQHNDLRNSSEVIVWDSKTGEVKFRLPEIYYKIYSSAFSPDGSKLAVLEVGFDDENDRRGGVFVWDVKNACLVNSTDLFGRLDDLKQLMLEEDVRPSIKYSPDGKLLMVDPVEILESDSLKVVNSCDFIQGDFLSDKEVVLFDANGIRIAPTNSPTHPTASADSKSKVHLAANFSSDRLAVCCRDQVDLYSAETLKELDTVHISELNWGGVSPTGNLLVAGDRDGHVHVVDLGAERAMRTLLGHESTITHGAFASQGDWLVTCSVDGTAKAWDLKTNADLPVFDCEMSHSLIGDLCFSGDSGDTVRFAGRQRPHSKFNCGKIELYQAAPQFDQIQTTFRANWPRTDMAFSPGGQYFCAPMELGNGDDVESAGYDQSGKIGIWNCNDWKLLASHPIGFDEITSLAWHPDGRRFAVAGRSGTCGAKVFEADSSFENIRLVQDIDFDCNVLTAMCFNQNHLAMAAENRIGVFGWKDGRRSDGKYERLRLLTEPGEIHSIDISPDGKSLAVAVKDLAIFRVYELETGKRLFEYPAPRDVCCIRYSPCGDRLALSGYDSLVYLCDAKSGHRCLSLVGCEISPGSFSINSKVIFSADGQRIATNNWKGEIRIWSAKDDSQILPVRKMEK